MIRESDQLLRSNHLNLPHPPRDITDDFGNIYIVNSPPQSNNPFRSASHSTSSRFHDRNGTSGRNSAQGNNLSREPSSDASNSSRLMNDGLGAVVVNPQSEDSLGERLDDSWSDRSGRSLDSRSSTVESDSQGVMEEDVHRAVLVEYRFRGLKTVSRLATERFV